MTRIARTFAATAVAALALCAAATAGGPAISAGLGYRDLVASTI